MLISQNFCLKPFTTFGVEVRANEFAVISSVADLNELFDEGFLKKKPLMVLGGGSNVLFTDHFKGLMLSCQIRGKQIVKETDDEIFMKVGSGEYWTSLVNEVVDKGFGGIENLSLIPGKVGAAPIQNIGAYGTEVKNVLESLEAFDLKTGKTRIFTNGECELGYRTSIFKTKEKGKYFILNVTLRLSKKPKLNLTYAPLKEAFKDKKENEISIKDVSEEVKRIRDSKLPDPDKLKNAGSFFKNPVVSNKKANKLKEKYPNMPLYPQSDNNVKLAAGWLIDQCGWRGKRVGDAGVHDKQALVIVNYDSASGEEIYKLSKEIKASVKTRFGVKLEAEVNII